MNQGWNYRCRAAPGKLLVVRHIFLSNTRILTGIAGFRRRPIKITNVSSHTVTDMCFSKTLQSQCAYREVVVSFYVGKLEDNRVTLKMDPKLLT